MVEKMGSNNVKIPKYAYFHYGDQERNPKSGRSQSKDKGVEVYLNINQLEPIEIIFSGHYQSRLPGRVFVNIVSKVTYKVYKGSTILCDSDSIKISVHHQFSFTDE